MKRSTNGGTVAIIITIILTGGLVYVGVSNQRTNATATPSASSASTAGHHGGASGPINNLNGLVGKPAPDFSLTDHNGRTYSLADLKGKNTVLFFNEGMMCYPACWNQIASLGFDERFKNDRTVVLSVVVDSAEEWQQAIQKMPELGSATTVHDTNGSVSSAYGMLTTNSSMHYGQLPGHSYVVIDQEGIVRHAFDDPNMALHNDQLVDEIEKLSQPPA